MKLNTNKKCSIFLTAGYPNLDSAITLIPKLEKAGVDLIELGIPFSDPLADGEVIQKSSTVALKNGMDMELLFEQLIVINKKTTIPVLIMGYFNPIFKYGVEQFLKKCSVVGVNSLIIPDMTVEVYENDYQELFRRYNISLVFLITPDTNLKRIRRIEKLSTDFIYLVSSSSITGKKEEFTNKQLQGFKRIKELSLSVPVLVGFGIHNRQTFKAVCDHFDGAIIGSAFIKSLEKNIPVEDFVKEIIS